MFGHSLLPVHSGGRLLLGGAVCVTVVHMDSSMPTPYSLDISGRVMWFVWNLRLTKEEVAFPCGVSLTWMSVIPVEIPR